MEDNFNQDRLEEFFRKSLEHFEENPAPDAWEKIRRSIPEKEKNRNKGAWLWLSLLILLLVIAGSHFLLSERFEQLEERVEHLETTTESNLQDVVTTTQTNNSEQTTTSDAAATLAEANLPSTSKGTEKPGNYQNPVSTFSKKNNTKRKPLQATANISSQNAQVPTSNEEAIPNQIENPLTEQINAPSKPKKHSEFEGKILEESDLMSPELTEEEENLLNADETNIVEKEDSEDTYPNSKFKGPEKDPGVIFPFELAYGYKLIAPQFFKGDGASSNQMAWDIQLLGDIPLNNKWNFQMGVGYRQMSFSGTQHVSGLYSEVGATGNTDIGISKNYRFEVENEFTQIALLGKITQTFDDTTLDPNLENEDYIHFSTNVDHQTEHLIFPFLISRHGNGERWNWRVKTGVIGTVRIKNEIKADVFGIENDNIRFEHESTVSTYLYDGPKIEWALSAGLEFNAFGDYWLFAEPAMNMSVIGSYTGAKPLLYGGQVGLIWRPTLKEKKN